MTAHFADLFCSHDSFGMGIFLDARVVFIKVSRLACCSKEVKDINLAYYRSVPLNRTIHPPHCCSRLLQSNTP